MPEPIISYRVFLAYPSDLKEEQRVFEEVVKELNKAFARKREQPCQLLPISWDYVRPGVGRPQANINKELKTADLVIACIWKSLGSPSGDSDLTGFQEEVQLALDCGKELWLLFKKADFDTPEKERVKRFRQEIIELRTLLFKDFEELADWGEFLRHHLLRWMLDQLPRIGGGGTIRKSIAYTNETTQPEPTSARKNSSNAVGSVAGLETLSKLLAATSEAVGNQDGDYHVDSFSPTDALTATRLMIFSTANYNQSESHNLFGVHVSNSAYYYRKELEFTYGELLLTLDSMLAGPTSWQPGWYWVSSRSINYAKWLRHRALHASDESVRVAALELATSVGRFLFNLRGYTQADHLLEEGDVTLRRAAIKHAARLGTKRTIKDLEKLFADPLSEIRDLAQDAVATLKLRIGRCADVQQFLRDEETPCGETLRVLQEVVGEYTDSSLFQLLLSVRPQVRWIAGKELLDRGTSLKEFWNKLTSDSSYGVRQIGFTAGIREGCEINLEEAEQKIAGSPLDFSSSLGCEPWERGDIQELRFEFFLNWPERELVSAAEKFDRYSATALKALCVNHLEAALPLLRRYLVDDFEGLRKGAAKPGKFDVMLEELFSKFGVDSLDSIHGDMRCEALDALSENAETGDDRIFLKHLDRGGASLREKRSCLRGLGVFGSARPMRALNTHLNSDSSEIKQIAAERLLDCSKEKVPLIQRFVGSGDPCLVWVAVKVAVDERLKELGLCFRVLLGDKREEVRLNGVYYFIKAYGPEKLVGEIQEVHRGKPYFYDVVVIFDRVAYAPRDVRTYYLAEEKKNFESRSAVGRRGYLEP